MTAVGDIVANRVGSEHVGTGRVRRGEVLVAELIPDELVAAAYNREGRLRLLNAQCEQVLENPGGSLAEVI